MLFSNSNNSEIYCVCLRQYAIFGWPFSIVKCKRKREKNKNQSREEMTAGKLSLNFPLKQTERWQKEDEKREIIKDNCMNGTQNNSVKNWMKVNAICVTNDIWNVSTGCFWFQERKSHLSPWDYSCKWTNSSVEKNSKFSILLFHRTCQPQVVGK